MDFADVNSQLFEWESLKEVKMVYHYYVSLHLVGFKIYSLMIETKKTEHT